MARRPADFSRSLCFPPARTHFASLGALVIAHLATEEDVLNGSSAFVKRKRRIARRNGEELGTRRWPSTRSTREIVRDPTSRQKPDPLRLSE